MQFYLKALFILSLFLAKASFAVQFDLYSESVYAGREALMANSTRLRTAPESFDSLSPFLYVQGGTELQTMGLGNYGLDPGSSYVYLGPGVGFPLGRLVFRADLRARLKITNKTSGNFDTLDLRGLAVIGDFLTWKVGLDPVSAFAEPYTELVFTSADFANVVSASYLRAGFRLPLASKTQLDLLVEPFATVDRVGHYYNNRADLKIGMRFQQQIGPATLSVFAAYVMNSYFSFAHYEKNPYLQEDSGVRVLAVVGGWF